MPTRVAVHVLGIKKQGKNKGAPLYKTHTGAYLNRSLTEEEIDQFHFRMQQIIEAARQKAVK